MKKLQHKPCISASNKLLLPMENAATLVIIACGAADKKFITKMNCLKCNQNQTVPMSVRTLKNTYVQAHIFPRKGKLKIDSVLQLFLPETRISKHQTTTARQFKGTFDV